VSISTDVRAVWCVKHDIGWCATKRGRKPSRNADSDETRCGGVVILRIGSEKRLPDCGGCLKAVERYKERER
jgi:hypothetical protein